MECKGLPEEDLMYLGSCINRNIVECKVDRLKLASDISLSINRNIVECKDAIINRYDTKIAVLIETLWNVKLYCINYNWFLSGINRNIVECKEIYRHF